MKIPKILGETFAYKSPRTQVKRIQLQFGNTAPVEWEYPEVPDGANAVPILPNGDVILVREWRSAWRQSILQIPGATVSQQKEIDLVSQIHRELKEEIGMDARKLQS